jgi:hypothetical protein
MSGKDPGRKKLLRKKRNPLLKKFPTIGDPIFVKGGRRKCKWYNSF